MDNHFLVVEKILGDFAFCEDSVKNIVKIPLLSLPEGIKPNDCIRISGNSYIIDEDLTVRRKKEAIELTKKLSSN